MSNPHVHAVGDLEDHDGMTVIVGVDYETVTIHRGIFQPGGGIRFTAAQLEEFTGLLAGARREALAEERDDSEPITDVPMVCTLCRRPVVRTTGITPAGWKHASPLDSGRCIHVHGRIAPAAMVAAGNEKVPR